MKTSILGLDLAPMRDWIDQERAELIHKAHQIGQLTVRPKGIVRVKLVHADNMTSRESGRQLQLFPSRLKNAS